MLLRNFDFATKYFDYKSKTEVENYSNPPIKGWYKFINGLLSALLVIDNKLYFLYGEQKVFITDSHKVVLKEKSDVEYKFHLIRGNDIVAAFSYSTPDSELNVSPFEYIDEDDFNWGVFVSKIINDQERKRTFVRILMESD